MKIAGESNRWYQLTGLTPFTRYAIQVAAENGVETGPYNDPPINMETLAVLPTARAPSHQPITPQPCYNSMLCEQYTRQHTL